MMEDSIETQPNIIDAVTLRDAINQNNSENSYFISSEVSEMCKKNDCLLGIDEAGRGPTLGPMVYSAFYCVKDKEKDLSSAGCADSKTLSEEKREAIFEKLCTLKNYTGWNVEVISPKIISNSMLRKTKVSLNEISHNAAIGLVKKALAGGVKITEMYVDTVGPADKYQAKLEAALPGIKVTVSKKADSLFPVVSAASICAKVTRDTALKLFKCPELPDLNLSYGSGYPNDPATKKFLVDVLDPLFGFPQLIRFSWSTAEKIINEKGHRVDWDDDDDESTEKTPSVKTFFKTSETQSKCKFFKDRNLTNTANI